VKKVLRSPGVQWFLGLILAGYLILIRRTTRWTHVGLDKVEPALKSDQGAVALFWHGRIPLCLGIGQIWWPKQKLRCLVSPSSDGEFIAQALARARFPAIRASSAKKGDSAKARAVVAAFREAMKWVSDGGVLIVTPDGPRGPNEVIASGSLQIAKRTGAPVYLHGLGRPLACARRRRRRPDRGTDRRMVGPAVGGDAQGRGNRRLPPCRLIPRACGER